MLASCKDVAEELSWGPKLKLLQIAADHIWTLTARKHRPQRADWLDVWQTFPQSRSFPRFMRLRSQ